MSIKIRLAVPGSSADTMRLALFTDIHANRQAFAACLDVARSRGAERLICLGDIVGYGADPEWAVDTVMDLVANGAIAVRGNHDDAVGTPGHGMNADAQAAIDWTRGRLSATQRAFLTALPMMRQEDNRLYVHAEASDPAKWRYVRDTSDAARSLLATELQVTFCGHIHRPGLYSMSSAAKLTSFVPTTGVAVQLLSGRRWLAVLGSVGQPRDGDPAASFAMYDTASREITFMRVPYDVETAAARIKANGLPHWLADRLIVGR
jgi:diadenosine tetraphosphatase ApaH/serine/threonine PP2A family protein phosphatase